jgi:hypothetical protein
VPLRSTRERAFAEGGEGLDERDQCDPGRVVRVAVSVRVDCALEARQELVRARVDRVVTPLVGLPAGDANRQHCRRGCDPAKTAWPVRPDEQPRHLGAVPLGLGRVGRLRVGFGVRAVGDQIDPVEHVAVQVRLAQVDTRVEQRDRHAAARDPGEVDVRTLPRERAAA